MKDPALEYSISRSTSKDLKPLKPKHIQLITMGTAQRDIQISDMFKSLGGRLRETNWAVVFKSLLVIHLMIREGNYERVLGFMASNPGLLDVSHVKDKQDQLRSIRAYAGYLEERADSYKFVKEDFARGKQAMISLFKQDPLDESKLKFVKCLQRQIDALLACSVFMEEYSGGNVISIQAFRLLIGDLISMFHVLNEAVVRLLSTYFEMEKPLAKMALEIYKNFAEQTKRTTAFFDLANRMALELGLQIPQFKHAPASLATALADHLKAPNFEEQRLIYKERRAQQLADEAKLGKKKKSKSNLKKSGSQSSLNSNRDSTTTAPASSAPSSAPPAETSLVIEQFKKNVASKGDPVLIDFFASIDDEVSAFEDQSTQAQYNYDVGSFWYPEQQQQQQYGVANPAFDDFDNQQTQIQEQLKITEQMFANVSVAKASGSYPPAPLSTQSSYGLLPVNAQGFIQNQQPAAQPSYASDPFGAPSMAANPFGLPSTSAAPFTTPGPSVSAASSASPFNPFGNSAPLSQSAPVVANPFGTAAINTSLYSQSAANTANAFAPKPVQPAAAPQIPQQQQPKQQQWIPQKSSNLSQGFNAQDLFGDLDSLDTSSSKPAVQNSSQNQSNAFFAPQSHAAKPVVPTSGAGGPFGASSFPGNSGFPPTQNNTPFGAPIKPLAQVSQQQPQQQDPFNFFSMPPAQQQQSQQSAPTAFNPFGDLTSFPKNPNGNTFSSSSNYVASSNPPTAFNPQLQPRTAPMQPFGTAGGIPAFANPGQQTPPSAFGYGQAPPVQPTNPHVANPFAFPIANPAQPSQSYNFQK